jgi:hypothetical protein
VIDQEQHDEVLMIMAKIWRQHACDACSDTELDMFAREKMHILVKQCYYYIEVLFQLARPSIKYIRMTRIRKSYSPRMRR